MAAQVAPKKIKSALKRARQTERRTLQNKSVKNMLKTLTKKVEPAVADKNTDNAGAALKEAISAITKAGRKGILHRNAASRKVSRLTRLVNSTLPSEVA